MASQIMLLTGCASGIGRHLAGALSARGHRIVATDLDEAALAREAEARRWDPALVKLRRLDVRSEQDWDAAVDAAVTAFGRLDVVMNIAGYLHPAYVADLTARDVDLHFDVNAKGVALGTRAAARRMIAQRAGHIVNIGSLASLAPVPGLSLYSASKFAVRGFSLAAAMELAAHGVAVTLVMPDAVETPMLDKQVAYEEAAMTFSGSRSLTVEDVERVIVETVLPGRPLEVTIPLSRGLLARASRTRRRPSRSASRRACSTPASASSRASARGAWSLGTRRTPGGRPSHQRRPGAEVLVDGRLDLDELGRIVDDEAELAVIAERSLGEVLRADERALAHGAAAVDGDGLRVDVRVRRGAAAGGPARDHDPGAGRHDGRDGGRLRARRRALGEDDARRDPAVGRAAATAFVTPLLKLSLNSSTSTSSVVVAALISDTRAERALLGATTSGAPSPVEVPM